MRKYWSSVIQDLDPYVPGEQPQDRQYIKLNTNENPFPPSQLVQQAIRECVSEALRLYPDPEGSDLKKVIAAYYAIKETQVFLGNGSDEVLALTFLSFFKNGRKIAFPDVTYSFYPVYCSLFEIEYECSMLTDLFEIDIGSFQAGLGGIIFPNPNAPTGIFKSLDEIEQLLRKHRDIVVVIDEAYVDFGGESCVPLIDKYDNLLVIQTLSKSRSLAGLRVGFALGSEHLVAGLTCAKNAFNSYPLDRLAIKGAAAAFQDDMYFERCRMEIIKNREWLSKELRARSYFVLPSKSNFVFARHPDVDGRKIYEMLKNEGVLVRYFDGARTREFVRITIGTENDMQYLAKALDRLAV